jgi:flagellar biosynthesis/type III secretory pathway chaperone
MNNQSLDSILDEYEALIDSLSNLLKQEQALIKQGVSLDNALDVKRGLLGKITELNARLQAISREGHAVSLASKPAIERVQNRLMSVLKLDRSVEKAYLSLYAGAPAAPKLDPEPIRVVHAYQRQFERK